MNIAQLARDVGLDEAEYREILDLFMQVAQVDLASIKAGLASGDAGLVARAAHSIKGASANLGLPELSNEALNIEERSRSDRLEETRDAARALETHLTNITRFLASEAGRAIAGKLSLNQEPSVAPEQPAEKSDKE
jgi:HPt (histidine-containing phosphotransfer) domain-containing protein